jgi:hypothetical protein
VLQSGKCRCRQSRKRDALAVPCLAASELNGHCLFPGHQVFFAIWEQNRPRMTFT